ncbi:MAG: hypothetical protein QM737_06595 [Ferruginibacter sp.]
MKRILLYFFIFTGIFSAAHAQDGPDDVGGKKQERVKALYVAYVTKQLNLTETEAQKFWPVHAEFQREIEAVNIDMPELERQQTMLNIKKKYQDRFTGILGSTRSNNFYRLHGEFTKKLVDEMRKRRQQNNNMPLRPGKRRNM